MSTPSPSLTSTSYAILGMVGMQPCTTYELGKAMQHSFDFFWPRARSLIYSEVKRLARLGFLEVQQEFVGRRARWRYTITPTGRAVLAGWLATPPRVFALEIEALLRVYLAPFGTRDDLLQALETGLCEAETMQSIAASFQRAYLSGTSPAMDQVHVRALLNDFLANFAEFMRQWAERSLRTVGTWSDLTSDGKQDAALATLAALPPTGTNPSARVDAP
jgi:DNA-binding PadR family transcriptional regulator